MDKLNIILSKPVRKIKFISSCIWLLLLLRLHSFPMYALIYLARQRNSDCLEKVGFYLIDIPVCFVIMHATKGYFLSSIGQKWLLGNQNQNEVV